MNELFLQKAKAHSPICSILSGSSTEEKSQQLKALYKMFFTFLPSILDLYNAEYPFYGRISSPIHFLYRDIIYIR